MKPGQSEEQTYQLAAQSLELMIKNHSEIYNLDNPLKNPLSAN